MQTLQERIRPSADLRNHYSEISKQCREGREAVIITVNGRGDTVSLGYEEYNRMKARIELLEILAEAEEDVRAVSYTHLGFIHKKKIRLHGKGTADNNTLFCRYG